MGRIITDMGKALVAVDHSKIADEPREELEEHFNRPEIRGTITFENLDMNWIIQF